MTLVVDVSLPAAPASSDARARSLLLDACSEALPEDGTCTVGAPTATATASVLWLDENTTQARISVRRGDVQMARTLRFLPSDPPDERLRSIGFAIGTLVPATRASIAPSAPTPPAAARDRTPDTPVASALRVPPPSAPHPDRVAVGLAVGLWTGAAGKPFPGTEARIGVALGPIEPTLAGGATVEREEGPKVDTAMLWSSVGLRVPLWSSLHGRVLARVEGLAEQAHAELYTLQGVRHRYLWIPCVRAGFDAEIPASGRAFVTAGVGAALRTRTAVPVPEDQPPVTLGRARVEATVGIGTRF